MIQNAAPGRATEENAAAAEIELTAEQREALEEIVPPGAVAGERHPAEGMATVEL